MTVTILVLSSVLLEQPCVKSDSSKVVNILFQGFFNILKQVVLTLDVNSLRTHLLPSVGRFAATCKF